MRHEQSKNKRWSKNFYIQCLNYIRKKKKFLNAVRLTRPPTKLILQWILIKLITITRIRYPVSNKRFAEIAAIPFRHEYKKKNSKVATKFSTNDMYSFIQRLQLWTKRNCHLLLVFATKTISQRLIIIHETVSQVFQNVR